MGMHYFVLVYPPWTFMAWIYLVDCVTFEPTRLKIPQVIFIKSKSHHIFFHHVNLMCFDNWSTFVNVNYVNWSNITSHISHLNSLFKIPYQNWTTRVLMIHCVTMISFFIHVYAFCKLSCHLCQNLYKHHSFLFEPLVNFFAIF